MSNVKKLHQKKKNVAKDLNPSVVVGVVPLAAIVELVIVGVKRITVAADEVAENVAQDLSSQLLAASDAPVALAVETVAGALVAQGIGGAEHESGGDNKGSGRKACEMHGRFC